MVLEDDVFQRAIARFKLRITKNELEDFQFTTLNDVRIALIEIQEKQGKKKEMMNLTRIQGFLEAMEQYSKIIEVFLNSSMFLAFVWGPMKFLLQVASNFTDTFETLLDAYQQLAENIPLLEQYQVFFQKDTHLASILSTLFEDILEFHQCALRLFQQPTWRQLFRAAWKDFNARFKHILDNLRRHKELVEKRANLIEIQESRVSRALSMNAFAAIQDGERQRKQLAVVNWLSAVDVQLDQDAWKAIWQENPNIGRWIFEKSEMKAWCNPENYLVPKLWLHGIPGAGKTILASIIVEECQKSPCINVVYFYCMHEDHQRNTFLAVARAILAQLLVQNKEQLLPYMYEQCIDSCQSALVSVQACEDLLRNSLNTASKTCIVIDGLDECIPAERKLILSFFSSVIDGAPAQGMLRGLFVSQNESDIKKLLRDSSILQLRESDNRSDILSYATLWSQKVQDTCGLETSEQELIIKLVCERAEGMFLFAKLVLTNLLNQARVSKANLYAELRPNTFPKDYGQAYGRIVKWVFENPIQSHREISRKVLGWVVCARRPLKWHEIQGVVSIDPDNQTVEFDDRRLRTHVKDLCGSLVEILPGDRVVLVHHTAAIHLTTCKYIDVAQEELNLAILCLRYLAFECFDHKLSDEKLYNFLIKGFYAFQDYAVLHWVDHLETSTRLLNPENSAILLELHSAIEDFHTLYSHGSVLDPEVKSRLQEEYAKLKGTEYEENILLLISQARNSRCTEEQMSALSTLGEILMRNRSALETLGKSGALDSSLKDDLLLYYGPNWNKCPRHQYFFFHEGFPTESARDRHVERHERPFCCTEYGCPRIHIGFGSEKELKKHISINHPDPEAFAFKFPKPKKEPTKYTCELCQKDYTRANSLRIHLRTHTNERSFRCTICDKSFVRKYDCDRHMENLHDVPKNRV